MAEEAADEPTRTRQEVHQQIIATLTAIHAQGPQPDGGSVDIDLGDTTWTGPELVEANIYMLLLLTWFADEMRVAYGADLGEFLQRQGLYEAANPAPEGQWPGTYVE